MSDETPTIPPVRLAVTWCRHCPTLMTAPLDPDEPNICESCKALLPPEG